MTARTASYTPNETLPAIDALPLEAQRALYGHVADLLDDTLEELNGYATWYANEMKTEKDWIAVVNASRPALMVWALMSQVVGRTIKKIEQISQETLDWGGFLSGNIITDQRTVREANAWLESVLPALRAA